jgi:DUF971 family protein
MQPLDIQHIGDELAIRWDDNTETYIPLEKLRRACPCATCQGEADITGHVHKGPEQPLTPQSFKLSGIGRIGTYAIQLFWADGHSTGIYSWDYLKRVAQVVA